MKPNLCDEPTGLPTSTQRRRHHLARQPHPTLLTSNYIALRDNDDLFLAHGDQSSLIGTDGNDSPEDRNCRLVA